MKKLLFTIIALGFIYACSNSGEAEKDFMVIENEKSAKLDSLYSALYHSGNFNGNVLIAEGGDIIYEKAFGNANETENRLLNTDTKLNYGKAKNKN